MIQLPSTSSPSTPPPIPAESAPGLPAARSALSPADISLLAAFHDADSDPLAVAAASGLNLADLLAWLAEPRIQPHLARLKVLRELRREVHLDAAVREAIDGLRSVLKASEDLVERRLAATGILRAVALATRPPRVPASAPSDAAPRLSQPTSPDAPPPRTLSNSHAPTRPITSSSSSPDETADRAIAILRDAAPADARQAVLALDPLLDEHAPPTPAEARAIVQGLADFVDALPDADITSEPALLTSDRHAAKTYTLTRAGDPPARFSLRLRRAAAPDSPWCFHSLTPLDSG